MLDKRILVLAPDVLPYPGLPTTGSALRAWGVGNGFAELGCEVVFSMPRFVLDKYGHAVTKEMRDRSWDFRTIREDIRNSRCDFVVACGWPAAMQSIACFDPGVPVLLDQHGPHLLERQYQGYGTPEGNRREKERALARADYFTCAGDIQLEYFQPMLRAAGWTDEDRRARTAAIPLSLCPRLPERCPTQHPTFVFGGVFLPWQDPVASLSALVDILDQKRCGRLLFFGGKHGSFDIPSGVFDRLLAKLAASPSVRVMGMVPHGDLLHHYAQAHVAIDLMARNPERELAFTTRTVEYLWCGLPVIYNDYSELSRYIAEYEAGWVLDPADEDSLRHTINQILEDPADVERRSHNARRLVRQRLSWDRTAEPLRRFADGVTLRKKPRPPSIFSKDSIVRHYAAVKYYYQTSGVRGVIARTASYLCGSR